jgi:hypothetical protein
LTCHEIARLLDELVDGTLDPARASGVRGHARGCPACAARLAETEALVAAMAQLEPLEPPSSLWAGIRGELDRAEAADAARPRWWWWWQGARKQLAWGGAAFAGAALCAGVWIWKRPPVAAPSAPVVATVAAPPAPAAEPPQATDPMDEAIDEIQKADAEYQKAMKDLETAVASEKPHWRPEVTHAFEANLATIDAAVAKQHEAYALHPQDLAALDALQASYQKRIEFLQEAVVRGGAAPAAQETL